MKPNTQYLSSEKKLNETKHINIKDITPQEILNLLQDSNPILLSGSADSASNTQSLYNKKSLSNESLPNESLLSTAVPILSSDSSKKYTSTNHLHGVLLKLSSHDLITFEILDSLKYELSDEGKGIILGNSEEYLLYQRVLDSYRNKNDTININEISKITLGNAIKQKYVLIEHNTFVPVMKEIVGCDYTKDALASVLNITNGTGNIDNSKTTNLTSNLSIDNNTSVKGNPVTIKNLLQRKLIKKVNLKIYRISRGTLYSTVLPDTQVSIITSTNIFNPALLSGGEGISKLKRYNYNTKGAIKGFGSLHPLTKIRLEFKTIFLQLGFTEMLTNKYVESSFWNFDALFQPQLHVSRSLHDTFFIKSSCKSKDIDKLHSGAGATDGIDGLKNPRNIDTSRASHIPLTYLNNVESAHLGAAYSTKGYKFFDKNECYKNVLRTHTTAASVRCLYKLANDRGVFANLQETDNECVRKDIEISRQLGKKHQEMISNITKQSTVEKHCSQISNLSLNIQAHNLPDTIIKEGISKKNLSIPKITGKYFSIDKVFRNESLDSTHLAEFHQVEGLIIGENLGISHLKGILTEFFTLLGMTNIKFKPAFNPYTEPSMEVFAYHPMLKKWMEVGNSGIFRPEMLAPLGFSYNDSNTNSKNIKVIAWGLSLERPAMIKFGKNNIRDLIGSKVDLNFVQECPFVVY
ncbi:putative phenylalanine--tRNA ligase alpha subunit [Cucumispora dikerogammari]|nr:putative phenylalanine--tRNA ligase alpha subunit [Cucumispora dikerogammari]